MERLDVLIQWMTELKNYTQGQAPDVINQLMAYTLLLNQRVMWICVVCLIGCILLMFVDNYFSNYGPSPLSFVGVVGIVVSLIFGSYCYFEIQKIKYAPKVFVLDYVTSQIGKLSGGK